MVRWRLDGRWGTLRPYWNGVPAGGRLGTDGLLCAGFPVRIDPDAFVARLVLPKEPSARSCASRPVSIVGGGV
ncbi:unnamed protein product [Toxocara canis]|uniref:BPL/LPL catalytic domain-containing protein n=1 Tax=Toxocara canis TaxID=6265 RepID=A0A183UXQ1_TOXCA|nr:unnamed protein product [Toxocara canis]